MAKRGYNRVCVAFGGADVFKKGFLEKLPLNLNDTHVVTIAQEYGWQDQWMAKAEKKRGRQQALDNAAAAASGDVGAMLRVATGSAQQQQSAGNGPQVEGNVSKLLLLVQPRSRLLIILQLPRQRRLSLRSLLPL